MHSICFSDSSWVQVDPVARIMERVHVHFAKWEPTQLPSERSASPEG